MAFSAITNPEIAADAPFTQALARKLRDNMEAHNHALGQGGTLVASSWKNGFAVTRKLADSGFGQKVLAQSSDFAESATLESFFPGAPDAIIEDTTLKLDVNHTGTLTAWLIAYYAVTWNPSTALSQPFSVGLKLDATVLDQFVRHSIDVTDAPPMSAQVFFLEQIAPGTHTIIPVLKGEQTSGSLQIALDRRVCFARLIGAV